MAEILVVLVGGVLAEMALTFLEILTTLKDMDTEVLRHKVVMEAIKEFLAEVEIHMIAEQTLVAAVEVDGMAVEVEKTSHPQVVAALVT